MRRMSIAAVSLVTGAAFWLFSPGAPSTGAVVADDDDAKVLIRDDCDPEDPAWTPTGGCTLEDGDVTFAEFIGELSSPLSLSVIGHQAWRNDPPYLKVEEGEDVEVRNKGGRSHTFTEVANFGGGRIPPLNQGLIPAPECAAAPTLPPGAETEVSGLSPGNHRFQCCLHPWMRMLVKVEAEGEEEEDEDN